MPVFWASDNLVFYLSSVTKQQEPSLNPSWLDLYFVLFPCFYIITFICLFDIQGVNVLNLPAVSMRLWEKITV